MIAVTRMARILEVDYANQLAVVEPGLVNLHLSQALGPRGFYYAPDPSSQLACTIGGNVANNSGGPHTLKYGVTTNHVLGVEVVLPDGEVVWLGGKVRDPQGYDLVGLFVGSEGTFGIVTKVVVRIVRRPPAVRTLLAVFDQLDQASRTVAAITARGLTPAAIEMIDQLTIQAVEDAFGAGYPRDAAAALLIELDGLETGLDDEAAHVVAACREAGARDVRLAQTEAERQLLWKGRKLAFGAYGRVAPAYMVMDGVIPRTRLPEVLRSIERIVTTHSLRVGNVFHAGDGNLHPNILYDPRKPGEEARVLAAGAEIMRACVDAGGTISGEHGIGLEKRDFMPWIFSEADLATMAAIKAVFNPDRPVQPRQDVPDPEVLRARRDRLPAASARGQRADPAPLGRARARRRPCPPPCSGVSPRSSAPPTAWAAPIGRPTWWTAARRAAWSCPARRTRWRAWCARPRRRACPCSRGAAGPRCPAARRRGTAPSWWDSGGSRASSSTSPAISPPPSRRGSRWTRSRPRWGRATSGCRSIRRRPARPRSAASWRSTPRGRGGTGTAPRATSSSASGSWRRTAS